MNTDKLAPFVPGKMYRFDGAGEHYPFLVLQVVERANSSYRLLVLTRRMIMFCLKYRPCFKEIEKEEE